MNIKPLLIATLLASSIYAYAGNDKQTVAQVTDAVELNADVDFIITDTTPFATTGSVNITNTEHAVVILPNIRPSKVTSSILSHIFINGQKAVKGDLTSNNATAGSNCQVKMYNQGSIILPYDKDFKPLTVYSEKNFEGDMYNNYTEGSSGGYMKTLTAAQFNNKIRSFKLKRGYMVTFAVGTGGWGYSRCFIADNEDLEIASLPAILDQRISSYRIFKWWNSSKKGVHDTGASANSALGTTWAFDWAQGNASLLPDVEWVPNHIYEDWPSSATCGGVTGSCHMKTNNEPANSADDHPQDVQTVLNNWENLMRTGMRLCSPATHDGGWGWHNDFMKAIDARGWRCDIVDFHGYWDGEWGSLDWRIDTYAFGRPVWFSEWLWGASWNKNGAFASGRQSDNSTYEGTKPILERLNGNTRVERYAYWNSEQGYTKIWRDNARTKLGDFYSKMDAGLAYNAKNEYIPRETTLESPSTPTATYTKATSTKPASVKLDWTSANGDLAESITLQCKLPGESRYTDIGTVAPQDKSSKSGASYTFTYNPEEPGTYTFRVKEVSYNNKTFTTDDAVVNVAPAQGTNTIQYGKLTIDNTNAIETSYSESMLATPAVFIGTITNNNGSFKFGNNEGATNTVSKFSFQMLPWLTNTSSMTKSEEVPFLAMVPGNYKFGDLDCEVGSVKSDKATDNIWTDVTTVTFNNPFPEGVTPIVLTEIKKPSYTTKSALNVRVFDVTNTGFKFIVYSEDKSAQKIVLQQNVSYLAITPGLDFADKDNGIMIAAGHGSEQIYGSTQRSNNFTIMSYEEGEGMMKESQLYLYSPTVLTALQTNNYPTMAVLRRTDVTETIDEVKWTTGTRVKRVIDHEYVDNGTTITSSSTSDKFAAYRDNLGWLAIAAAREGGSLPTAIKSVNSVSMTLAPRVVDGKIYVEGVSTFDVYSVMGAKVENASLTPGTYVVKTGNSSAKIVVK